MCRSVVDCLLDAHRDGRRGAWATAATTDRAAAFCVGKGSPLLVIETVFFTTGDRPAGWRSAVHQAENFKYRFSTGG